MVSTEAFMRFARNWGFIKHLRFGSIMSQIYCFLNCRLALWPAVDLDNSPEDQQFSCLQAPADLVFQCSPCRPG